MEQFLSILVVILIWSVVSAASRKKPQQNRGQNQAPRAGGAAPKASAPAPKPAAERVSPVRTESHSHPEPQGNVYQGSLGFTSAEGMDPCHDDPQSMPSGSLHVDAPEGTDPCHDGMSPVSSAAGAEPEIRGLNLQFSGNDIVKGFVWGEILNRKRA